MKEGSFPGDAGYGLQKPEDPLPKEALDALDLVNRRDPDCPHGPQDEEDDSVAFPSS